MSAVLAEGLTLPPSLAATVVRAATGPRFKVLSFREVEQLPDPEWLVEGIIPAKSLAILYGPPGVGKTFLALDIALSIASAEPWASRQTIPGPVVYVVAEGVAGLSKRLRAWAATRGIDEVSRFYSIADAPQLASTVDTTRLIVDLREQVREPISLIVIDTMARCFVGGDENSAKDVGQLIANVDRLSKQLGCTVLLVHHTTKSGESERGSSALRGALETMISLDTVADDIRVSCEKQKNAAPFASFTLHLVPASDSCVLRLGETEPTNTDRIGTKELQCLQALDSLGAQGASWSEWRKVAALPDTTFQRHREKLLKRQYVEVSEPDERYQLTLKGRMAVASTAIELLEG